jgi:hypothetical protein
MSTDSFSSQWISTWPSKRDALSAAELSEVITTYVGVESPAARLLVGRPSSYSYSPIPLSRPPAVRPSAFATHTATALTLSSYADGL